MSEVAWLPEALDDIRRLHAFLSPHNAEAAARAAGVILRASDRLLATPQIGRPMADGTARRELTIPFGGGAYVLRYRLEPHKEVIIRVWHSREERTSIPPAPRGVPDDD